MVEVSPAEPAAEALCEILSEAFQENLAVLCPVSTTLLVLDDASSDFPVCGCYGGVYSTSSGSSSRLEEFYDSVERRVVLLSLQLEIRRDVIVWAPYGCEAIRIRRASTTSARSVPAHSSGVSRHLPFSLCSREARDGTTRAGGREAFDNRGELPIFRLRGATAFKQRPDSGGRGPQMAPHDSFATTGPITDDLNPGRNLPGTTPVSPCS